jgi:hypothetical protein
MKAFGLFIAATLLAWTSLIYARLRPPRRGTLWLPLAQVREPAPPPQLGYFHFASGPATPPLLGQ